MKNTKSAFLFFLPFISLCVTAQLPQGTISFTFKDNTNGYGISAGIHATTDNKDTLCKADGTGHFVFTSAIGTYNFDFTSKGYNPLTTQFTIEAGKLLNVNVTLDRADANQAVIRNEGYNKAIFEGTVVDSSTRRPLSGVTVLLTVNKSRAITDSNGHYLLESKKTSLLHSPNEKPIRTDLIFSKTGYGNYTYSNLPALPGKVRVNIDLIKNGKAKNEYYHQGILDNPGLKGGEENTEPYTPSNAHHIDNSAEHPGRANSPQSTCSVGGSIRVGTSCSCNTCSSVSTMSLETYVGSGLDDEWISSWNAEALKAGAVAYRSYGGYFINNPINANYDISSTACKQVWGSATYASCTSAASATAGVIVVYGNTGTTPAMAEYAAEAQSTYCNSNDDNIGDGTYPCNADAVCDGYTNSGNSRGMCQWGTERWATNGELYASIVDHYYNIDGMYRCSASSSSSCTTPSTPSQTDYNGASEGLAVTSYGLTPTLTWTNVGATCYYVYILDVDNNTLLATQGPIYGTSYTVPSGLLTDGTNYRWNLQADANCDGVCMSAYPSAVYFFTCNCPVAPAAASSISATQTTICSGQSTTLTAVGGTTGSCGTWFWYTGSCNSTAITYGSSTITVSPGVTTTYFVNPLDDCHNTYPACASITITVASGTTPNANISSSTGTSLCNGQSTTLSVPSCSCTYNWSNGATTYNDPGVSSSNTYYVTVTNGCNQSGYGNISISAASNPTTPTFSLSTTGCNSVSVMAYSNGNTYRWSNGQNTQTATFTTTGTYSVTATNSSGCTASAPVIVTVNSNPTVSASAATNPICSGSGTTLTANGNTTQYEWSNSLGSGSSVTAYPSSTTTYTVTATSNSSTCTATSAVTVTVNPTVHPNISISPLSPTAVCSGNNSTTFTPSPTNGGSPPSYSWSSSGGQSGSANTFTLSNITANTTVICTLTSNAECASPTTASATVNIQVTQPVTPSVNISASSTTLCINSPVTLTPAITNAPNGVQPSDITWYSDGSQIGSGSSYTYNGWSSSGTHSITCTITYPANACVTQMSINSTNTLTINVQTQAPAEIQISANNTTICQGQNVTFTATPTNGGSPPQYQWQVNSESEGTNSSTFTYPNIQNGDTIDCILTSNSSCAVPNMATSDSIIMTVNAKPTAVACCDTNVCAGDAVTLSASGGASCIWPGIADSTSYNPIINPSSSRAYTVIVTAATGCMDTASVNIAITPPAQPTPNDSIVSITQNGSGFIACFKSISLNTTNVHWDFGDGQSSNISSPCHVFSGCGPYIVTLTAYNTCGISSDSTSTQFPLSCPSAINQISSINSLSIIPNPSSGQFMLSFETTQTKNIDLKVFDALGRIVWSEKLGTVSGKISKPINLQNVSKGIYLLQLQVGSQTVNHKIVVE